MLKKEIIDRIFKIEQFLSDTTRSIEYKTIDLEPEIQNLKTVISALINIEMEYDKEDGLGFVKINKYLYETDPLYKKICLEELIIRNFRYGFNYDEQIIIIHNELGAKTTKPFIFQTIQNYLIDKTRYDFLLEYIEERQPIEEENVYVNYENRIRRFEE